MRELKDRIDLVTGGGCGIGEAICRRLGEEGCVVGVLDIDCTGAEATAQAIEAAGGRAHACVADITDCDAVAAGAETMRLEATGYATSRASSSIR